MGESPEINDEPAPRSFRDGSMAFASIAAFFIFADSVTDYVSVYFGIGLTLLAMTLAIVYVGLVLETRA